MGSQGSEGFGGLGRVREAGEQIGQVGLGVDASAVAVADEGIKMGGAFAAFGIAHEKPVLLADRAGPDGVLDQIVVDLDPAVLEEHKEFVPLAEGVSDSFAGEALGQVFAPGREVVEPGFDLLEDGQAVGLAFGPDGVRPGPAVAQAGFDLIELLHLQEDPGGILPLGFGVEKVAPRMGHAAGQFNSMALGGPLFDKTVIRFPAVALDDAPVVGRNDASEAVGPAPGAPREVAEVAHRIVKDPKVAGASDAFSGRILIFHGSLIGLHITVSKNFLFGGHYKGTGH